MTAPATGWLALVESNTTGSGRLFCAAAGRLGLRPVLLARDPGRYPYVAADRIDSRVVDTGDPAAVRAACASLGGTVAGVTSSSEYYVAIAGVADARRVAGVVEVGLVREVGHEITRRQSFQDRLAYVIAAADVADAAARAADDGLSLLRARVAPRVADTRSKVAP